MMANRKVAKKRTKASAGKDKRTSTSGRRPGGNIAAKKSILNRRNLTSALASERLQAVYEQSPLSIQVFSASGDALTANRAWEELWGSGREQLKGYNVLSDPQVKARGLLPYFEKALKGEVVSIPPAFYDPAENGQKGRARWTKAMIYPVKDSTGKVREITLTHEDITERQQAEESISRNYQQLLSFVEQAPLSIAMFDRKMNYLAVSRQWISEYGRGYTDLLGRNHYDVHPDLPDYWKDAHRRGLAGEALKSNEDLWIDTNGTKKWLRWAITPWMDTNGDIGGIIISAEDISARKLAEENIREYADIVGNMQIGLYVFHLEDREDDRSLRLVSANPAALKFSGTSAEEVVGKRFDEGFPDLREMGIPQKYADVIRTQQAAELEVAYYDNSQQVETAYAVKAFPLPNDHLGVAFEDTTRRKQAEDELKRSHSLLNATLESTADGILVVDSNGKISGYNRKFLELWRIPEDLASKKDDRILLEFVLNQLKDSSAFLAKVEALYASPEATSFDELEFLDGRVFERYSQPQRMANNIIGRVWSFRDITGRKLAEGKLRESEKRFRALIENGSDEISLLSADGRLLYESPSLHPTLGYAPGDFLGQSLFQLVHPDDIERVQRQFSDLSKKPGESLRDQFRLRHNNGTWRWVEAMGTNLLDEPAVRAIVVNYHDITERKKAEDALQENEQRYRGLFEDSPVSIWEEDFSQVKAYFDHLRSTGVTDFRTYFEEHPEAVIECIRRVQVLDVNRTTLDLMRVRDKTELLTALSESLNEEAIPTVMGELISLAEGNLMYESDEVFVNRLGEKRDVFFKLTVAPGYEDTLGRVFVSIIDVTERKVAEEALRESENRYSLATRATNDVIWEWNLESNELFWNENAQSVFGYSLEEIGPREIWWEEHLHPQDRDRVLSKLKDAFEKSDSIWTDEYRFLRKDGSYAHIVDRGYVERDAGGKGLRMIGAISDITSRKEAEKAVQESESRHRAVFENTPVAIWEEDFSQVKRRVDALKHHGISDLRGYFKSNPAALRECMDMIRILDVNEMAVQMFEAESKEELIRAADEEPSKGEFEHNAEDFALIAEGVTHGEWEGGDKTLKGRPITIHLTWSVVPGHEADYSRVIVTTVDITERKQAEAALRDSQARYRSLFENSPISLWEEDFSEVKRYFDQLRSSDITDFREYFEAHPDAVMDCARLVKIVDVNRATLSFMKVNDKSSLIAKLSELLSEDALPAFRSELISLAEGKLTYESDGTLTTGSGVQKDIFLRASVAPGYEATLGKVFVSIVDITERKQAEEQVRKSEQRYHALFEDSPISIWEEDFSAVKKYLDDLKAQGITDLRAYFQTNPEAISQCATLIQVLDVNNAALRMYQAETKAELIEATQRVLSQGDQQHNLEDFVAISEGRTSNYWEGEDETLAGEPIEISLRWSVAPGHENDYSKVIVTVIDVTDRNEAVKQLQQSEERFRLLASNIQEVFWITDPIREKDLYLSPAYEAVWNRKPEEQLQNHDIFLETVLPEDRQMVIAKIEEQRLGQRTEMEYRIWRPDGSIRWIWDRAFPIVDDSQKVKLITGIAADITERKKAESETLRHLDELQALYENGLAVGRLLTTREIGERVIQTFTQYLSWHHVTIRLRKGESDDLELVAFNVPNMNEDEKADVERKFSEHISKVGEGMSGWVVQTGAPIRTGNVYAYPHYVDTYAGIRSGMYMPLKVGDQIIGSISVESEAPEAFSVQDERLLATLATQAAIAFENARLYQAIQQELSERRRAEAMLERERNSLARRVEERTAELIGANSNLARALRVKDEFLANMSHELRTPLNAILGLSESLGEQVAGSLNDKQQKYVQTITESGHHLLALINDILDLAKIEAGQVTLDISRVDVHSLCQSSLRMVKQLAQKKSQEVVLEIDENFGLIWADERRLKQMIVNLLSNAVKFTPEGGQLGLEVHGDQDENRVLITVWDNGIGIAEEDIAKLFQPFVQLSTGLARESTGTGLGLALVAQMARLHGGGVSVSSLHGEGSRFTLVLPWEPALAVDAMERMKITGKFRAVRNISEHERRTILLIEDTPEVVMMVRDYLEAAGYNVSVAEDGLEGMTQAKRSHPDLILMDLQMPRMDGFEATRNLRSDPDFKSTPIIALTALAMQGDRERCLAAGMDEYITKPVNLKGLVKIIEACLTQPQEEKKPELQ